MPDSVSEVRLTREEALKIQELHFRAVISNMERQSALREVYLKYGIPPGDYDLNISTGEFVRMEKKDG